MHPKSSPALRWVGSDRRAALDLLRRTACVCASFLAFSFPPFLVVTYYSTKRLAWRSRDHVCFEVVLFPVHCSDRSLLALNIPEADFSVSRFVFSSSPLFFLLFFDSLKSAVSRVCSRCSFPRRSLFPAFLRWKLSFEAVPPTARMTMGLCSSRISNFIWALPSHSYGGDSCSTASGSPLWSWIAYSLSFSLFISMSALSFLLCSSHGWSVLDVARNSHRISLSSSLFPFSSSTFRLCHDFSSVPCWIELVAAAALRKRLSMIII